MKHCFHPWHAKPSFATACPDCGLTGGDMVWDDEPSGEVMTKEHLDNFTASVDAVIAGAKKIRVALEDECKDATYKDDADPFRSIPFEALCLRYAYDLWLQTRVWRDTFDPAGFGSQMMAQADLLQPRQP